jgi:hypothetical protein
MAPETNDLEWPRWPSMPLGTGYEAGLRGRPVSPQTRTTRLRSRSEGPQTQVLLFGNGPLDHQVLSMCSSIFS